MKRILTRKRLTWLVVAALAALAIFKLKFAPASVIPHVVARGEAISSVLGTGTLEARVKTTISANIQERLTEVLVDQGSAVKKGQLLARLDDAGARQQVAIAAAALTAARQTAARVSADLARSEAVLEQAERDATRMKGLAASQAVSQADADKSSEAWRIARADLNRSRAAIDEAGGLISVAEKTLLYREEQLAFTEIHAPYDGLIIRRDRDPGDVLVPGASLMQIIALEELWISAWVDETAMPQLTEKQSARIVFRSEPGRQYPGTVARLGRETDRETREFLVDVHITEMPKNWTIGQRAEVFIETARDTSAVLLPEEYLIHRNERSGVYIQQSGRAQWREIKPGLRGQKHIAITEGLLPGEEVIRPLAGGAALTEGTRIAPQP